MIDAVAFDSSRKSVFHQRHRGSMVARYRQAIMLLTDEGRYIILANGRLFSPDSCEIPFLPESPEAGDRFYFSCDEKVLYLGNEIISLEKALTYESEWPGILPSGNISKKNAGKILVKVGEKCAGALLAKKSHLFSHARDFLQKYEFNISSFLKEHEVFSDKKRNCSYLDEIIREFLNDLSPAFPLERIAGLGEGSTPAGDDFIRGMVVFLKSTEKIFKHNLIDEFGVKLGYIISARKTAPVSLDLLVKALEGRISFPEAFALRRFFDEDFEPDMTWFSTGLCRLRDVLWMTLDPLYCLSMAGGLSGEYYLLGWIAAAGLLREALLLNTGSNRKVGATCR